MGSGDIKLKCACGHIMNAKKADTLNDMAHASYWKCIICKRIYIVTIIIEQKKR